MQKSRELSNQNFFNVETLEHIAQDIFEKNDATQVSKDIDFAFIELLRGQIADDSKLRNEFINSWFAIKKAITIIDTKALPESISILGVNYNL